MILGGKTSKDYTRQSISLLRHLDISKNCFILKCAGSSIRFFKNLKKLISWPFSTMQYGGVRTLPEDLFSLKIQTLIPRWIKS